LLGSPAEDETNREQLGKLEILRYASRGVYSLRRNFEQSQKLLSYYIGAMDCEVVLKPQEK